MAACTIGIILVLAGIANALRDVAKAMREQRQ
jgi:hypothetical protein